MRGVWRSFAACLLFSALGCKVLFVTEVTSPGSSVPLNVLKESQWTKVGYGQLTDSGRRTQYLAGADLKFKYPDLLNTGTLPFGAVDYSYFQKDNTITSGHIRLYGLYENQQINKDLPFDNEDTRLNPGNINLTIDLKSIGFRTPLPNGILPPLLAGSNKYQNSILLKSSCPEVQKVEDRMNSHIEKVTEDRTIKEKIQKLIQTSTILYGQENNPRFKGKSDLKTCHDIADFVIQEYYNDPKAQFDSLDSPTFVNLRNCHAAYQASLFSESEYLRAYVTPILSTIKSQIAQIVDPSSKSKMKYMLHSVNQEMVMAIMLQSKLFSSSCIFDDLREDKSTQGCYKNTEQTSTLAWEVHREGDQAYIQTKLNGLLVNFCHRTDSEKDYLNCPVGMFNDRIDYLVHSRLDEWCNTREDPKKFHDLWKLMTLIMIVIVVLFALGSWIQYNHFRSSNNEDEEMVYSAGKTIHGETLVEENKQ